MCSIPIRVENCLLYISNGVKFKVMTFIDCLNKFISIATKLCTSRKNKTERIKPWIKINIITLIKIRND